MHRLLLTRTWIIRHLFHANFHLLVLNIIGINQAVLYHIVDLSWWMVLKWGLTDTDNVIMWHYVNMMSFQRHEPVGSSSTIQNIICPVYMFCFLLNVFFYSWPYLRNNFSLPVNYRWLTHVVGGQIMKYLCTTAEPECINIPRSARQHVLIKPFGEFHKFHMIWPWV